MANPTNPSGAKKKYKKEDRFRLYGGKINNRKEEDLQSRMMFWIFIIGLGSIIVISIIRLAFAIFNYCP